MSKRQAKPKKEPEMRPEYDLSAMKGVRGKYYKAYRKGYQVKVHHTDGTVEVRQYSMADGAVMIEPDVRRYFPDADSVNTALRSLIRLIPSQAQRKRQPSKITKSVKGAAGGR